MHHVLPAKNVRLCRGDLRKIIMNDFEAAKQLFVEGLQFLEANNLQAAESKFARSLEFIPDRVSTLNNLAAIKIKLDKFAEAEDLARKAITAEDQSPESWSNLGIALTAMTRHEEALQAYDRALDSNPACAQAWLNKAKTLLELKKYDEALTACDQALKLNPGQYENLYTKSLILKELDHPDEAQKVYLMSLGARVASSPVFVAERRPTQKADVLIISHNPTIDGLFQSFENLHVQCSNFPGQLANVFQDEFHFSYVFESDAMRLSARKQISQPGLVINNCANGELVLSEGKLSGLTALVDSFGVPVINHPSKVVQSVRDVSTELLANLPGIRVPKTMRFSSGGRTSDELVREIEGQYDYPVITRTLSFQEGEGMTKVDSREVLVAVLSSGLPEKFYVTEFVDSQGGNPFFRKIRAAVVRDEIIITRVDYDSYWNVHGRKSEKRVPFYLENRHLLDEEKRICKDPEAALGRAAIESLRAIRNRIPLDVFGIDFEVNADGMLIFYEANATMNLLMTADKRVPNPKEADDRLKESFRRYLTTLALRC